MMNCVREKMYKCSPWWLSLYCAIIQQQVLHNVSIRGASTTNAHTEVLLSSVPYAKFTPRISDTCIGLFFTSWKAKGKSEALYFSRLVPYTTFPHVSCGNHYIVSSILSRIVVEYVQHRWHASFHGKHARIAGDAGASDGSSRPNPSPRGRRNV